MFFVGLYKVLPQAWRYWWIVAHHSGFNDIKWKWNNPTQLSSYTSTHQPNKDIMLFPLFWLHVPWAEYLQCFVCIKVDSPTRNISPKCGPEAFIHSFIAFMLYYLRNLASVCIVPTLLILSSTFENFYRDITEITDTTIIIMNRYFSYNPENAPVIKLRLCSWKFQLFNFFLRISFVVKILFRS